MTYRAKAATVGNSKALRLDSALFREHPEFASGEFTVNVIAPGRLLVQASSEGVSDDETDPVFDAFLGFLEHHMAQRPDLVTPATRSDLADADELLVGVTADRDADLGESFRAPGTRRTRSRNKRNARASKK